MTAQLVAATADDPAKVKLTAKNKGALGNTIDIRLNYLGASGSEYSPLVLILR